MRIIGVHMRGGGGIGLPPLALSGFFVKDFIKRV